MLKLINIRKSYGHTVILDHACFDARAGALTILEGQNGVGKSTLFGVISGTIAQDSGDIFVDDIDLGALSAIERALHIAVLQQDPKSSTVSTLSVLENCALALLKGQRASLKPAASQTIKEKAVAHLKDLRLNFAFDLDRSLTDFSGGQRQMIAFAMATIIKPRLMLLDEPTAALDNKSAETLMTLVKNFVLAWDIPAIMISHNHELNRKFADDIFLLENQSVFRSV